MIMTHRVSIVLYMSAANSKAKRSVRFLLESVSHTDANACCTCMISLRWSQNTAHCQACFPEMRSGSAQQLTMVLQQLLQSNTNDCCTDRGHYSSRRYSDGVLILCVEYSTDWCSTLYEVLYGTVRFHVSLDLRGKFHPVHGMSRGDGRGVSSHITGKNHGRPVRMEWQWEKLKRLWD